MHSISAQPNRLRERVATVIVWSAAGLVAVPFIWLAFDVFRHGLGQINWTFLTTEPLDAGRAGGISTVIVSTLLVLLVCIVTAAPLGIATALFLSECIRRGGRTGRAIRGSLDLLASVPSIVFGLFGMVFFAQVLNMGLSILSGGLTLACMVLPIIIRTTEAGLAAVLNHLRSGAAALGLSQTTTLMQLLLPAAMQGVVVGLILGVARALAETAALIFTSGYVTRMPTSLLHSGRTLSVHIYDLAMNVPGGDANAYGSALVLAGLLLGINAAASVLTDTWLRRRDVT